jgi:WD40 repeat protein
MYPLSIAADFCWPVAGIGKRWMCACLVCSGDDTLIKLWDVHRGKAIHSFDSGHSQSIGCVRFLPDCGSTRVVTGSADKQVRPCHGSNNATASVVLWI